MKLLPLFAATAMATLCLAPSVSATPGLVYSLAFDEAFVIDAPTKLAGNGDPRPVLSFADGDDIRSRSITVDKGSRYRTWLQSEVAAVDVVEDCPPNCGIERDQLAFQIGKPAPDATHIKEKVMLPLTDPKNVVGTQIPTWSAEAEPRYVSFDFMVDPTFEPSRMELFTIHFQLMQGSGHPVFTMETQRVGKRFDLVFYYTNDETEEDFRCAGPAWEYGLYRREFHRVQDITLGEWKTYVFEFVAPFGGTDPGRAPLNPGRIAVDVGNTGVWADTGGAFWGYRENSDATPYECGYVTRPTPRMNGTIGIYRAAEGVTQTVHFDNVRFGTTVEAVTAS